MARTVRRCALASVFLFLPMVFFTANPADADEIDEADLQGDAVGSRVERGEAVHQQVRRLQIAVRQTTLVQRADDQEDAIRQRLASYRAMTRPLIDYYRERGLLYDVDGDRVPEEVARDVIESVTEYDRLPVQSGN